MLHGKQRCVKSASVLIGWFVRSQDFPREVLPGDLAVPLSVHVQIVWQEESHVIHWHHNVVLS